MKKQLITLVFVLSSFVSSSQIRKPTTNDNLMDYLSEVLKVKVCSYIVAGYETTTKDSLRYEITLISIADSVKLGYNSYCNESLDLLFESKGIKFPLLAPFRFPTLNKTILINFSQRTQRIKNCQF